MRKMQEKHLQAHEEADSRKSKRGMVEGILRGHPRGHHPAEIHLQQMHAHSVQDSQRGNYSA